MNLKQIIELVKDNSFFIQLSSYEGMAMSVVESMQLGLVPIVTNVGEIENYCTDGFNSIIYEGVEKTFLKVLNVKENIEVYKYIRNNSSKTWINKNLYKDDMKSACKNFVENEYNIN